MLPAAAAPSAAEAVSPASNEQMQVLLKMLQRSSRSPEDLIEGAVELSLVGLLSRETLVSLCKSVGLGDDQSAQVVRMQKEQLHLVRSTPATSSSAALAAPIFPWRHPPTAAAVAAAAGDVSAPSAAGPSSLLPGGDGGVSLLPGAKNGANFALSLRQDVVEKQQRHAAAMSAFLNPSAGLGAFQARTRLASEFEILGLLGRGGGGAVYRARHLLDGSQYAIKRVTFWTRPGAPVHSEAAAQRVLREVTALAKLNHPNVCRYYSAWVETDWPSFFNTVTSQGLSKAQQQPRQPRMMRLLASTSAVDELSEENGDGGGGGDGSADAGSPSRRSECSSVGFESSTIDDAPSSPVSPAAAIAAAATNAASSPEVEEVSEAGRLSELSASSNGGGSFGWANNSSSKFMESNPLSVDDPIFQSCGLCASNLGGGVAALLGGGSSEPGRVDVHQALGPAISVSGASDDLSESSMASTNNLDGDSLPSIASQRRATAVAGARPPSLARQWTYRKELLIQMELCETHTLRDYLEERNRRETEVDEGRAIDCLIQICQGLEHVHSCGIVHRDLKPSNCCFGANKTLKLMDFGLSRQRGGAGADRTPSYAAPEQMSGGALLAACDMFPLGLITYELFTIFGSAMERAKAFGELRAQRMPSQFTSRLPVLAPLVSRLLSESPSDRPTCSEMLKVLLPQPTTPTVRPADSPVLTHASPVLSANAKHPEALPPPLDALLSAAAERPSDSSSRTLSREEAIVEVEEMVAISEGKEEEKEEMDEKADAAAYVDDEQEEEDAADAGVGAGVDWRDDELTRRLLEMELLAEELRLAEARA